MSLSPNARTGKIARLPEPIRREPNHRLDNGEPGPKLLAWLNELPLVHKVLAAEFHGKPILKQNLSAWRKGGYQDWRTHQHTLELARRFREEADEPEQACGHTGRTMAETMSVWVTAHLAVATRQIRAATGEKQWRLLRQLCAEVAKLHGRELSSQRMQLEDRRLELQWKKLGNRQPDATAKEIAAQTGLEAKEVEAFLRAFGMKEHTEAMAAPVPEPEHFPASLTHHSERQRRPPACHPERSGEAWAQSKDLQRLWVLERSVGLHSNTVMRGHPSSTPPAEQPPVKPGQGKSSWNFHSADPSSLDELMKTADAADDADCADRKCHAPPDRVTQKVSTPICVHPRHLRYPRSSSPFPGSIVNDSEAHPSKAPILPPVTPEPTGTTDEQTMKCSRPRHYPLAESFLSVSSVSSAVIIPVPSITDATRSGPKGRCVRSRAAAGHSETPRWHSASASRGRR